MSGIVTWSGIRTHEAYAEDLKTSPFDRSGIQALPLLKEVELIGSDNRTLMFDVFCLSRFRKIDALVRLP